MNLTRDQETEAVFDALMEGAAEFRPGAGCVVVLRYDRPRRCTGLGDRQDETAQAYQEANAFIRALNERSEAAGEKLAFRYRFHPRAGSALYAHRIVLERCQESPEALGALWPYGRVELAPVTARDVAEDLDQRCQFAAMVGA